MPSEDIFISMSSFELPPQNLATYFTLFLSSFESSNSKVSVTMFSDGTISEKELKRLIKDMFMMIKEENPEEVKLSSMKYQIIIDKS